MKNKVANNNKHLMTGPEGNSEFCFPRISMTKARETLRFEGNKIHCSPRDQALIDLLYSKNGSNRWKTNSATAVNISRVTVNCFPVDVIIFAMLPAYGVWRESFIVRCHVTMNWPMSGRVVAGKTPAI